MSDAPLWYKDAVFYELQHVKAFQDSNGDGIGDFNGPIQRAWPRRAVSSLASTA